MSRPFSVPLICLALAGCAGASENFPSLAPRAVEKLDSGVMAPAAPQPAPAPVDPGANAAARAALAAAETGDRNFTQLLAEVEPVIRRAASASAGSEPWILAQQALSRLQAARLATADALQSLDDQRMARGDAPPDAGLESARARAAALESAQAEKFATLAALLPDG